MHNAIAHQEVESPWLCGTTALQQLTHPCAITTILILDPKDTTIPATIKEINSIPVGVLPWESTSPMTGDKLDS